MIHQRTAGALLVMLLLATGRLPAQAPVVADSSFRAFLVEYEAVLKAALNGDVGPWLAHVSDADDVTLFTGFGGIRLGPSAVDSQYRWAMSRFQPRGASVEVEYLAVHVAGDLAVTVSLERSSFWPAGATEPQPGYTRATQVYRREQGQWKLVQRHMDHLKEGAAEP